MKEHRTSDKIRTVRAFIALVVLVALSSPVRTSEKPDLAQLEATFQRIVKKARGRVGVALIHLESGATLDVRGHERFPMASVVKVPIAIEVLTQVAARTLTLDREVLLAASDIRPCCAIERRHPNGGIFRTVRELLELAIIESDNTAADALLKLVGGPDVVERRMRMLGFSMINVDRSEGQLLLDMAGVTAYPPPEEWTVELQRRLVAEVDKPALNKGRMQYLADERDTATPYETAQLVGRLQLVNLLPGAETHLLLSLMTATTTGSRRIRGRIPFETEVAHKTGSTAVVINDVGIITLPADSRIGGRLALAVYVADGSSIAAMERSIAELSAAAFDFFSGRQPVAAQKPSKKGSRR